MIIFHKSRDLFVPTFRSQLSFPLSGFVVILAYSMMGRTLCARKPPFDCDSVKGSASSQQVSKE